MGTAGKKIQDRLLKDKEPKSIDERYRNRLMGKCWRCKQHTQKYNCNTYREQNIPASVWCGQEDCKDYIEDADKI